MCISARIDSGGCFHIQRTMLNYQTMLPIEPQVARKQKSEITVYNARSERQVKKHIDISMKKKKKKEREDSFASESSKVCAKILSCRIH